MKILGTILFFILPSVTFAQSSITDVVVAIGKTDYHGRSDARMMLAVGYENFESGNLNSIAKCPSVEKWNTAKMRDNSFLLECEDQSCLDSLQNNIGYVQFLFTPFINSDLNFQCELRISYVENGIQKILKRTRNIKIPRGSSNYKMNFAFSESGTGE